MYRAWPANTGVGDRMLPAKSAKMFHYLSQRVIEHQYTYGVCQL